MSNRGLTKSYTAEGAIAPCRIVKFGAADYGVVQAAAATDKLIGVSVAAISPVSGEPVDVIHEGIADVELGDAVTRGDLLTTDADGKAVVPAPGAGANVRVLGIALVSGAAGDIVPVHLNFASFQG